MFIKSKPFFLPIIIASFFLTVPYESQESRKKTEKPNILLIMVDDMNDWVGYMSGYGGEVFTPNIDRLASEGVAFTNAHATAPVCNPTRNALMLGKLPSTTGLYNNGQWWKAVYPDEVTMPQYFKNHGYYTAGAGKIFHHTPGNNPPVNWHDFKEQVFDDPWNFARWSPVQFFLQYGYRGPIIQEPDYIPLNNILPRLHEFDWGALPGKDEPEYGDVVVVNYARDFLQQAHSKPFFLALGMYRPHEPWYVPQEYFDLYPLDEIVLPEVKENDFDDIPDVGRQWASSGRHFDLIQEYDQWKEAVQGYLASITFADAQVGAILDALQKSEYQDNTIIVFLSDHGFHLGEKGHWKKQTLWERSTRIPFIIKAPGISKPHSISDRPVDMLSVYPTLLSLTGLPEKQDLEGHDISPLLRNPEMDWDYPAITIHGKGNVAVRSQDWRYIRYHDGGEELYDHRTDPNEWYNLALIDEYTDIIKDHLKWVPESFAEPVTGKREWFFDPYEYTWLHRENGEFIDGNE